MNPDFMDKKNGPQIRVSIEDQQQVKELSK